MLNSQGLAIYRRLLRITRQYWLTLSAGVLAIFLVSLSDAAFAWLIKPIVNRGFISKDVYFISALPFFIVGVFVFRGITSFFSDYLINRVARNVVMYLRRQLFNHLLHLPSSFYDHHSSGNLLSAVIYNIEQVANASAETLIISLRECSLVLFLFIVMFLISWKLTSLFLIVAPIIFWITKICAVRLRRLSFLVQQVVGEVTNIVSEALNAYRVIRIHGSQAHENKKFFIATKKNQQNELKVVITASLNTSLVQILISIPIAILFFLATAPSTGINLGSFAAFTSAMIMILRPIRRLSGINVYIQKGIAGAQSIFQILDEPAESDQGKRHIIRATGLIEYEGVSFTYERTGRKVLHDIRFRVLPGQTIAIVGKSGSGKSTLINLLPRFYEVTLGNIRMDGINIKHFCLQDLRNQFSLVSQNMMLFNDTIANNISYGCYGPCDEQKIRAAAKTAEALEFIEALPQGIHTMIGENGVLLSGGQCQRIAIARAVFKDAPILILDEPTSALDQETEQQIKTAIKNLIGQRTTLIIAHRLSTIEHADCILVLDDGHLVEQGTHQDLLKLNGVYTNLYKEKFHENTSILV